jgi:hypothetical protein
MNIARCIRPRHLHVILLATALLASCRVGVRQGPPFDEAFPDASVLVTTTDPAAVRAKLVTVQLPATRAHHDRLLALLRAQPTIRAANLALLAHAVAVSSNYFVAANDGNLRIYGQRGHGEFAPVIDQLLTEGIDRVTDVDRRWLGELIGISQSDATMRLWADRFLARVDDGSPQALAEILDGMPGSPANKPFLVDYLAPKGALDGERGWIAFARMSFDSDRSAMLAAIVSRGAAIDGDRMVATMRAFSFDDARERTFVLLADKAQPLTIANAKASVATFSFDSGREVAFVALGKQQGVHLTDRHLVEFARMCSFDSSRIACVKALAPRLEGAPNAADAKSLLAAFSFDSDREAALAVMCARWLQLPAADREPLLATFSFDSNREQAARLLRQ